MDDHAADYYFMSGPNLPEVEVPQESLYQSSANLSDVLKMASASEVGGPTQDCGRAKESEPGYPEFTVHANPMSKVGCSTQGQMPSLLGTNDAQMPHEEFARIVADPNIPPSVKEKLMHKIFSIGHAEAERQTGDKQQAVEQEWLHRDALQAKHGQKVVSGVKMRELEVHSDVASAQRAEFNEGYMVARKGRQEQLLAMRETLAGQMNSLRDEIETLEACRDGDMAEVRRLGAAAQSERKELKKLEVSLAELREAMNLHERNIRSGKRDMPVGMSAAFARGKKMKLQSQIDDAEEQLATCKGKERDIEQQIEDQKAKVKSVCEEAIVLKNKHATNVYVKLNQELSALHSQFKVNESKINRAFKGPHKLMENGVEPYE